MSIFQIARENEENSDQQFQVLIEGEQRDKKYTFVLASSHICDQGRVSINSRPSAMVGFVEKNFINYRLKT